MSPIEPNFLMFFIMFLIAGLTAYYAKLKGRSPIVWFFIGILLGIFAPLILFLLPASKPTNEDLTPMNVLYPDPSLEDVPATKIPHHKTDQSEDRLWYYLDLNHQQMGPVSLFALRELWNRGQLRLDQYVWTEGMAQWSKVEQLPQLKDALNKSVEEE